MKCGVQTNPADLQPTLREDMARPRVEGATSSVLGIRRGSSASPPFPAPFATAAAAQPKPLRVIPI